jgi:hypothetical protein
MTFPFSQNELLILDRQMTMVTRQLSEIAALLESREGETTETATAARIVEQSVADLARKIHNRSVQAHEEVAWVSNSQTA